MTSSPSGRSLTQADFTYLERLAAAAADSGLYGSGSKTKAQLLMKLIYGRDLGISVSAALSGIDIYDAKMELSSNLIAALLEAHPHYAYALVESTNERCVLEFFKDGHSLGKATYEEADAVRAGLADTDYYRQYPSDMFFARAMTRGTRRHCPGLGRGVPIYATGELAKRTPEPSPGPAAGNGRRSPTSGANGGGAREHRATQAERDRIRDLGAGARLSDAELFNVLLVAAGSEPVKDEQRAARQLERALEALPASLVARVIEELGRRTAALAGAAAGSGAPNAGDREAVGEQPAES